MAQPKRVVVGPQADPEVRQVELKNERSLKERYPDRMEDSSKQKTLIAKVEERNRLITVAEKIAKDTFYVMNWYYDGGEKLFPGLLEEHMRRVSKYFPNAVGKPLLVDEPRGNHETKLAWEKHAVLIQHGYRHIVIETGDLRTSLEDALTQLGEL